jgi:hypothetical protein
MYGREIWRGRGRGPLGGRRRTTNSRGGPLPPPPPTVIPPLPRIYTVSVRFPQLRLPVVTIIFNLVRPPFPTNGLGNIGLMG